MKRKFGNFILMAAVVLVCLLLLPTEAKAASVDDLTFTLNDDGASYTVTDCSESASGELEIPATYNGLPVTEIGGWALGQHEALTNVTIPDSVTSIGQCAFTNCYNLSSITIPDSVTSIGACAFLNCAALTSVNIPASVISIGEHAFSYSSYLAPLGGRRGSLTGIWVDENNPDYSSDSFGVLFDKNKTQLIQAPVAISGEYTIPDSVTSTADYAFSECRNLTNVILSNCTGFGYGSFHFCSGLTSIIFPDGMSFFGPHDFEYCTNLSSVTLPATVSSIDPDAFSDSKLTDVYFTGTEEQWNAALYSNYGNIYFEGSLIRKAKLHLVDHCTVYGHAFDSNEDTTCNNCTYTRVTVPNITIDTSSRLVATDENTANINHRATVYFLGSETAEDINDEAALKAIDADAKTHWGLKSINKVQLLENGNYVILLHYNVGTGAKQTVAKAVTVNTTKPAIEMNGHKVAVTAGDSSCINYRATVYCLGENTVENITDETALKAAATSAKTYWGLEDINKVQLLNNGNYVILLHYNIGTGAKQTVAKAVTRDLDAVTLDAVDGKLIAADPGSNYIHHRAVVYYLGEETSIDNAVSNKTYWTLNTINKVQLTQPGNYVILLHYNLADSAKLTTTLQVTI